MAIIEVKVPSPGESISHVELARWLIQEGDVVQINTEIAELESDKATLMLVANQGGKVSLKASEGDSLEVGAIACTIDTSHQPESPQTPEVSTVASAADAGKVDGGRVDGGAKDKPALLDKVKVTPLAKKVMEQNDLSIDEVISGLRRLRKEDVEASIHALRNKDRPANSINGIKKPASRESRSERLSSLRRKLSQRLVSVKNDTAMLTTFNEVDMKAIMDLRKRHQTAFVEAHGVKLGIMSFFLKACSVALREFPNVNAALDGELLTTYDYVDISVAVSARKGLMVPVVRNVESLGLAEIERAIADVAEKARESRLSIPEMSGGTFTVTNGGVFGSMMSTPLINPPQSAILGMHNILERPVAIDGQVVIRPMMYVALSYDHRVVDGKESVSFLVRVKQLLENPTEMLYQGSSAEERLLEL